MKNNLPFVVQPLGGLANRMRVVAKCDEVAKAAGVEMQVCWVKDGGLNANYGDLFEKPLFALSDAGAPREVCYCSRRWYRRMPMLKYKLANGFDKMLCAPFADAMLDGDEEHPEVFCHKLVQWLKEGKRIFLSTGSFLGVPRNLSMFVPQLSITQHIEQFVKQHPFSNEHTYGVHIRRTDNTWAIDASPLALFEKRIESVLNTDGDANFYLATDDKDTISTLKERFGEHILVRDKDFRRSSCEGIKDAVVDMWLLSKTKEIFGSFYSSFSEMASYIGGNKLTIVKK
ncbi:MAG: hypothetical protein IJS00_04855 [Paludibacteraceae bacterium]|nr:hypothetical protein [Paludibacteraceae bacterium]